MGEKMVSKSDVILLFGVMYPYVSKKNLIQLTKPSATKTFSIN